MHKRKAKSFTSTQLASWVRLPLAAVVCFAVATPAFVQNAGHPAASSTTPTRKQKARTSTEKLRVKALGTIVVAAKKRTGNLQSAPISVHVRRSDQLRQLHIHSFNDYVQNTPNVAYREGRGRVNAGSCFASIYMRGA